ncbi:hypothetical protein H0920_08420 [Acinetobacter sp. C_4_1]|uniref:hypothetical protein n=1 Tax=unclassified Acinetobacter TaxID=196816 RepID=UPI0021B83CD2|nr:MULTISPECIES: hypothetical protein [unclassified Acinetobacter]MCT8089424.1 hypothetical protein [Acinetobacter sp. F_3_1]MCT8098208.1 hypothetical protein [Acinetobacter sp. C_3_1]MCT8101124.1 hypothetical protein [Acinetobacter sp. C_4_1]MCT8134875.1 hypothetical protein [Acinetobacter sp. T_3_1]
MPRIFLILALATCSVFGWMFYQYSVQQKELSQLHSYQTVLYEKAELIYQQAQDWSKPIEINVSDNRLQGDYKVMADFVLSEMIQNAEARNQYLRELKAIHWDQFLNIDRLDQDRKQKYAETEQMLQQAHLLAKRYQQQTLQREENTLARAKQLSIKSHLRHQLTDSLRESRDSDQTHALFALELQVLDKADALFQILKNNQWEKKNKTFMFYQDQPIKQFNDLYKQVWQLNAEMEKVKKHHRQAVEQRL